MSGSILITICGHTGKQCNGRTPMQTFLDSKHIAVEKNIDDMLRYKALLPIWQKLSDLVGSVR